MPAPLDRELVHAHLENFDLQSLFVNVLGWDHGGDDINIDIGESSYPLKAIAQKRGMVIFQFIADSNNDLPDHPTRKKIEKIVAKSVHEHIIVYTPANKATQYWQWVKREPGLPEQSRSHNYQQGQAGEALIQKLEHLVFTLEEEEDLTIVDVSGRVRAAFDIERVTGRFYERFKKEHKAFLGFIHGIENLGDREWYASLMLNRMMFIYFIQKRGFLDGDRDYLRNRIKRMQREYGTDRFYSFYRLFLLKLFYKGLGKPEDNREPELVSLLGKVPYLNGGLFDVHDLERDNRDIKIPDEAFEGIFNFFDSFQWHLDDRPLHDDNEINPDVLGYIFEKYINQKQMGAYYTKEDITGYICRNTIIPCLFNKAEKECPIAFEENGGVWRLLKDDPDRYFFDADRHGITCDIHAKQEFNEMQSLPAVISAGLEDVSKRGDWNNPAPLNYALPTETWREHIARRQHFEEVREKLATGKTSSISDLITYNLDIEKFSQDVIAQSEGPELLRAFWKAINNISVLDPTCGSGAFLFAALKILEPLYVACIEGMRGFLDDLENLARDYHPETMNDFRNVRELVAGHASERHFILKSIIIGNLYGVDIMEEAVEICKLRLFLKLVAQLDDYDQIEPLPDIDFNVRAGNTLVGFSSLDEVKQALGEDMLKKLALPEIEERADAANQVFQKFKSMQTELTIDAEKFADTKAELRDRLSDLSGELDRYLVSEYSIDANDKEAYKCWRESHKPFHWFVEFYGITHDGGFDIIVGNPPYVEYQKIRNNYGIHNYETTSCGNIYAFIIERSLKLINKLGSFSFIVPLSIQSTDRMRPLRNLILNTTKSIWFSSFDVYPSKLFEGAKQRLSIFVMSQTDREPAIWTTKYQRWRPKERPFLIDTQVYWPGPIIGSDDVVPKVGDSISASILQKLSKFEPPKYRKRASSPSFFVHRIPYNYVKAINFIPYFWNEVDGEKKSEDYKPYELVEPEYNLAVLALLNSNLFFWWWYTLFEGYHCGRHEIISFPCGMDRMESNLKNNLLTLSDKLMTDLRRHTNRKEANYKTTGKVIYEEFFPSRSKPIIDQIDAVAAQHFGLDGTEVDFLINFDIKFRLSERS